MALKVELANKAASSWTDITGKVDVFGGMRVGGNAHQGEIGTGSGFDLDDDDATVVLPVKRVVRVRDTRTSPNTILVRGRIASRVASRGEMPVGDARAFDVQLDDQNSDLRGIPIRKWSRPEESDYKRVIALWKRYLRGTPRASTRLRIDYVRNANRRTLPKQTYRDTDPFGVLADIADAAAKEFFVTVDGELFYDLPVSQKYPAGLSITDDDPNMVDEFPPHFGVEGDHDGSEFLSGATLVYGNNKRVSARRSAVEAAHDFWREIIEQDASGAADARRRLKKLLSNQAREDLTISCSLELTDDQVGLIKYGQTVSFRSAAAGVLTPVVLRVGRLMWEPVAPGRYRANLELGFPKKLFPRIRRGSGSSASGGSAGIGTPSQGTEVSPPAGVTRIYLDHFDRVTAVYPSEHDNSAYGAAVVTTALVTLPDGVDEAGRTVIIFGITAELDVRDGLVASHGFTALAARVVGSFHAWIVYRSITGSEGWASTGEVLSVAGISEQDVGTYAICLDGAGSIESADVASANPPSLDPSWDEGTATRWYTFVVADDAISGDPTGYDSNAAGFVATYWKLAAKDDDAQTEDPSAYTSSGAAASFTIALEGVGLASGLGSLPLKSEVGGWWPGGNPWLSFFAAYVGDHGMEDGVFFAESAATHETSGNNWIISVLGSGHLDGGILLPMQVDTWEMEMRYRLRGAVGIPADAGLRYLNLDWMFGGRLQLNFGDGDNAEGIQVLGETTDTLETSLPALDAWGLVRWRWQDGTVYGKVWTEGDTEPDWQVSAPVIDDLVATDVEFNIKGRLGNASGPVQRIEIDYLKMLALDTSLVGYAGEVYGLAEAPAA